MKLAVSLVLSLVAAVPSFASTYALSVAADRADAVYRRGEEVTFRIELLRDGVPADGAAVRWAISTDGVAPETKGMTELAQGKATIAGRLDEPGFLHCVVTFAASGGSTHVARAGAAIDPQDIRPSLPAPRDFDEFWEAKKRQLAGVPVRARLTPVDAGRPGIEAFDLQADCLGAPVSGYLARPTGAAPKSLPAILLVHGAGVRSAVLGHAVGWAAERMLALDINAHGLPNGRPEAFYKELAEGDYKDYRTRGRESPETIYFTGMFLRLIRALDVLTSQPEWDGRTVVVHGSSQGGCPSIVAAGLDPRVTLFAAGVPAGCDHTGFKAGRINGWPKFIAIGEDPPSTVMEAVRYVDAVNFAARVRCPGIMTVGFIDTTCPPTTVYAAYNALAGPKQIYHDVRHGHSISRESAAAMRAAILQHVAAARAEP